jgi:biopolymer transport protein ExbB/TolQ
LNWLTNAIYWISSGLLVPDILGLLALLVWSLLQLGDLFGAYLDRLRLTPQVERWCESLQTRRVRDVLGTEVAGRSDLVATLRRSIAVDWHPIHASKFLSDFELHHRAALDRASILIRTGPMLGLMGTLIHVGPAIRGLAAGDLAAMAADIEVVFTITVLGIFVGALGFWIRLVRHRWGQADLEFLRYAYDLAQAQAVPKPDHVNENGAIHAIAGGKANV